MDTVYDIRRRNLARLLKEFGAKTQLAIRLDMTPAQVSHWLRDPAQAHARLIHEDSARQIEKAIGLEAGSLDKDPSAPAPPPKVDRLLIQAATAVVTAMIEHGEKPTLKRVSKLTETAYLYAKDYGAVDEAFVQQIVKYGHGL